jgi:hypothetical protein
MRLNISINVIIDISPVFNILLRTLVFATILYSNICAIIISVVIDIILKSLFLILVTISFILIIVNIIIIIVSVIFVIIMIFLHHDYQ